MDSQKDGEVSATVPMGAECTPPTFSTDQPVAVDETTVAEEKSFPSRVVMPPHQEVKNYGELVSYLKQSDLIHKAFMSRFGMQEGTTATDDVETDLHLSDFLLRIDNEDKRAKFIYNLVPAEAFQFNSSAAGTFSLQLSGIMVDSNDPNEGECILLEAFSRALVPKLNHIMATNGSEADLKPTIKGHGNAWKHAVKSLKMPSAKYRSPGFSFQDTVKRVFDEEYHDHMNSTEFYMDMLLQNMTTWQDESKIYNAPYTSFINASMMGKSRLVKQISDVIPTVYMCVRNNPYHRDDGYPKMSPVVLYDYLENYPRYDNKRMKLERYSSIVEGYYMGIFVGILRAINRWTQTYNPHSELDLHLLRQRLWYHLAEPDKPWQEKFRANLQPTEDGKSFWETATRALNNLPYQEETGEMMAKAFFDAWRNIRPYLSVTVPGRSSRLEPRKMLLIVWDEARSLVEKQIPYVNRPIDTDPSRPGVSDDASLFTMIHRALRKLGRHLPKDFEMFNVFIDTTSRIGNFQPHGLDSLAKLSRRLGIDLPSENSRMFRPIVVLPGIDSAAYKLQVSVETSIVQQPYRLLKFGRPGWSLYADTKNKNQSLLLASQKLFREVKQNLADLFNPKKIEKDNLKIHDRNKLRFLACICSRLAIQTSSYVTATSELVSSHMMALLRISKNHNQLESSYLSEPVLAQAAAEATGNYGWVLPLKTLVSEMRAGIVNKGFRGEFTTRALVIIAMEDAQRKKIDENRAKGMDRALQNYWDWSQVVKVRCFLDALLQNTDQVKTCSDSPPSPKLPKRQNSFEKFEDALHDDDTYMDETLDGNPQPSNGHISKILMKNRADSETMSDSNSLIDTILNGRVFFNHWVVVEHPQIRPSIIVKAWNRCAALVIKDRTRGIDFLIPVLLNEKSIPKEDQQTFASLPLFGRTWTIEEEKFAEKFVSYILIQTKNRSSSDPENYRDALRKCIPVVHKDKHVLVPSFEHHMPQNPFVSILMEFGYAPKSSPRIQVIRTTSEVVNSSWEKETILEERAKILKAKEEAEMQLCQMQSELEKRQDSRAKEDGRRVQKDDLSFNDTALNPDKQSIKDLRERITHLDRELVLADEIEYNRICSKLQLPIVVLGLDSDSYKCLENRNNVARILEALSDDTTNPLRGLPEDGVVEKLLRTQMHLKLKPEKDEAIWPLPADH